MFWSFIKMRAIPAGYCALGIGRCQLPLNRPISLLEAPHKVTVTTTWEQTHTCRAILHPRLLQTVNGVRVTCCAFCLGGVLLRVCSQMSDSTTYT